jgi:hypothetical protein
VSRSDRNRLERDDRCDRRAQGSRVAAVRPDADRLQLHRRGASLAAFTADHHACVAKGGED